MSADKSTNLANSDIPAILNIAFKLNDWLNFLWNFYFVIIAVIVGWRFSAKESWSYKQKLVVSAVFALATLVNLLAIRRTSIWLERTLIELKEAANTLNTYTAQFKELLQKVPGIKNWILALGIHLITDILVIVCIWGFK